MLCVESAFVLCFFFFNDTATTEIYTLSLHDALPIWGLYLVGGGAHPGAGVPMATLSAKHAAAAILSDQTSTSLSPQTAMHGGMSTGSPATRATAAPVRSLSSGS